jgi:hypothetical protein
MAVLPEFLPLKELEKAFSGLADIMIELDCQSFDRIGALQYRSSKFEVSAVASNQTLLLGPTGPCKNNWEHCMAYYMAYAEEHLMLIVDEQTYINFPIESLFGLRILERQSAPALPYGLTRV